MLPLILANISGRRGFSLVTAIVVALGTTTFLVLVGLTEGTFREIERRMTNTNADLMVHKADWSPAVGSGWPLKLAMAPLVEEIEGVRDVIPIKIERYLSEKPRFCRHSLKTTILLIPNPITIFRESADKSGMPYPFNWEGSLQRALKIIWR